MTDQEIADHVRAQGINPEGGYELDDMVWLIQKLLSEQRDACIAAVRELYRTERPDTFFVQRVIDHADLVQALVEGTK